MLDHHRINAQDISEFFAELAALLKTAMPLSDALDLLYKGQEKPVMQRLLGQIHKQVAEQQISLSRALAQHPRYFPNFICQSLEAGDNQDLAERLEQLAYYRDSLELQQVGLSQRIQLSLLYPFVLFMLMLFVLSMMLTFVLPVFDEMFKGFGADLPGPTQVLFSASGFLQYLWLIVLILVIGFSLMYWREVRSLRTGPISYASSWLLVHTPVFSRLLRAQALGQTALSIGFISRLESSPAEVLKACAEMLENSFYARRLRQMAEALQPGETLEQAFAKQPSSLFPLKFNHTLQVAFSSLPEDQQALLTRFGTQSLERARLLLEPSVRLLSVLLLLLVWFCIGYLVVAMYLPLFKMGEVI